MGVLGQGMVGWSYMCGSCEPGFFVYMTGPGVLGEYLRILSIQHCCT